MIEHINQPNSSAKSLVAPPLAGRSGTNLRLNKFLSSAGLMSRRKADEAIAAGDVSVNGTIVKDMGVKIDPGSDKIAYKGKAVSLLTNNLVYYALYKPKGILSTALDEKGRESVTDLVPKENRVFPVGRLDKASEGLMILTNDGELAQTLTHPSFKHDKEYFVVAKNERGYTQDFVKGRFLKGINIDGKSMKADRVEFSKSKNELLEIHMVLHTGYNRQIRKMCDRMGLVVVKLVRTRIAKLQLSALLLEPGDYKLVSKEQII